MLSPEALQGTGDWSRKAGGGVTCALKGRCPYGPAAKSLQSCQTLCDPVDGSPPGSPAPGILQARTLEWGAIAFSALWATGAQFLWDLGRGAGSMHNKPGLSPKRPGSGGCVSGSFLGRSSPVWLFLRCVPSTCPGRRRPPGQEKAVSCRCGRRRLCWPAE